MSRLKITVEVIFFIVSNIEVPTNDFLSSDAVFLVFCRQYVAAKDIMFKAYRI